MGRDRTTLNTRMLPQILQIHKEKLLAGAKRAAQQVGWSQAGLGWEGRGAAAQKTKLGITRSIFELEARNFACK